jgi:hypothetical protein
MKAHDLEPPCAAAELAAQHPAFAPKPKPVKPSPRLLIWLVVGLVAAVALFVLKEVRRFEAVIHDPVSSPEFVDAMKISRGFTDLLIADSRIVSAHRDILTAGRSRMLFELAQKSGSDARQQRHALERELRQRFPHVRWPSEPMVHDFTSVTALELWWAGQRERYVAPAR